MERYQDIQIPDIELRNQFITFWLNGQYELAFAILDNNPSLDKKKIIAEAINLVGQALIILEMLFKTNVTDYFVLQLNRYNQALNDFIKRDTWSSTTPYVVGNFVEYGAEKLIYLCILENTNLPPPNTDYWALIGLRGEKGENSLDTVMKYEWKVNINYAPKDVVVFGDAMYVAKVSNIGKQPDISTTEWDVFLIMPKAKIVASVTPPTDLYIGAIWLKILAAYIMEEIDALGYKVEDINALHLTIEEVGQKGW